MYQPNWDKHDVRTKEGAEAFEEEREREMAANPQAKAWEESRKRTLVAQKHDYSVKEKNKETEAMAVILKNMKKAGEFSERLIPETGFILVKVDEFKKRTDTGIKLPDELMPDSNTGVIVEGKNKGKHILYKKGAGMDVVVQNQPLLLMRYVDDIQITDVLGVFE